MKRQCVEQIDTLMLHR